MSIGIISFIDLSSFPVDKRLFMCVCVCVCVCVGGNILGCYHIHLIRVQSRFCVMCLSWGPVHMFTS